ncbi:TspO/MBR family protein [Aquimarina rhabdastrellae]
MKTKIQRISIAVVCSIFIGFLSVIASQNSAEIWYTSINTPVYSPSYNILMMLWVLMHGITGIAAGIVWSHGFYHKWVKVALYHFGFQLILQTAWSIFLFGLHTPLIALLNIVALLFLLFFTFKWFKIVNNTAAFLLTPHIIFITFATILSYQIWLLN